MACIGCSTGGAPGCKSNGGCDSGGCNRMNTYDWISVLEIDDPMQYPFVEVSFKNGSHKEFFKSDPYLEIITGDWVVVETASGQDVGKVSLSGDLVRLQMKKKGTGEERILYKVVRIASDRDIDHMQQARSMEKMALVKGRAIARSLNLDMKLGDVEYQADLKKATFYYTADKRIDFRELVKSYAKEFRIKIEMRQIGARQESARIGGIGSCGRELCCSTWLSDFKTVVTSAARYQNLAINQAKLSGQCGRLKCCLNYELDVYMESLQRFPMDIEMLVSRLGRANLLKTDIFKGVMYYEIESSGRNSRESRESLIFGLSPEQVKAFKIRNDKGEIPADFGETIALNPTTNASGGEDAGFADVTGEIELPEEKRRKKKKSRPGQNREQSNYRDNYRSERPQNQRQDAPNQPIQNPAHPESRQSQRPAINRPPAPHRSNQAKDQQRKPERPDNRSTNRPPDNRPPDNRPPDNRPRDNRPRDNQPRENRPRENQPRENRDRPQNNKEQNGPENNQPIE